MVYTHESPKAEARVRKLIVGKVVTPLGVQYFLDPVSEEGYEFHYINHLLAKPVL